MSTTSPAPTSRMDRFLSGVERVGNKLPEPFVLFSILFLITAVVTTGMAWAGATVQLPGAEEVTQIQGLFTGEGRAWISQNIGQNYIGFPPLLTVITILLAVGIAERSGLLTALIRKLLRLRPPVGAPVHGGCRRGHRQCHVRLGARHHPAARGAGLLGRR